MDKKYHGIIFVVIAIFCGVFILSGKECLAAKKEKIVFENIENKRLDMYKGQKKRIKIDTSYLVGNEKINWSSSNKKIVSVNKQGVLKAKRCGKVKITARIKGKKTKTNLWVEVSKLKKAKKIQILSNKKYLLVGESLLLKTKKKPLKSNDEIVWKSSDEDIAVVDENGCVTGVSDGKVVITAKAKKSRVVCKKKFSVYDNKLKSIYLTEKSMVLGLSENRQLTVKKNPDFVTNDQLIYTSSDSSVASVDASGVVTGKKKGKAVIKVTAVSNKLATAKCTITVSENKGYITKQMLDKLDLKDVDNLMIVAHPDDETLWGGGHLISDNYLVVCLTNGDDEVRKRDFMNCLKVSKDKGIILSYPDLIDKKKGVGIENRSTWEYEQLAIRKDIDMLLKYKKWNIVVTHNPNGEYGHQHHKYTSKHVTDMFKMQPSCAKQFMYFGKYYSKNEITPGLKEQLPELPADVFKEKKKMMDQYQSKKATLYQVYYHMTPYEDWIPYEDWK
ncbi:MAG: Ig-like domain-containing protein [Clostridium sp.]|nr:Ig-like domain-containing protein [Clostridium sp.]